MDNRDITHINDTLRVTPYGGASSFPMFYSIHSVIVYIHDISNRRFQAGLQ